MKKITKYKDKIILIICLLAIFQLYLYTTFPAFKNDDSPETITSAYTLGISHPPGYPLYIMAGKVFSLLPIGSPAFRMNLFAIFLAMLVLLFTPVLLKRNSLNLSGVENKTAVFSGLFILAFSYIFWNQAIGAKGGIYILNILFFAILLYLSTELLEKFNLKYAYLISFIFGLSLANHWPSMIILLPVFGYSVLKRRKKITSGNVIIILMLFFTGISPYIYLFLRAQAKDVFINMARPNTWENFRWTVLRSAYAFPVAPSFEVYKDQVKEFLHLFINDFLILIILIVPGCYALWKKNRRLLAFYACALAIIISLVLFYNRSDKIYIWTIDNFLMPAQYIFYILILDGICYFSGAIRKKSTMIFSCLILFLIIIWLGIAHFKANNNRENYISYDFGSNEIATMEPGSFYIPFGDYYILPFIYEKTIGHKADKINFYMLYNLTTKWGIKDFNEKYGNILSDQNSTGQNIKNIINKYAAGSSLYINYENLQGLEAYLAGMQLKPAGLLYRISSSDRQTTYNVFKNYSYRGIFDACDSYDKLTVSEYGRRLSKAADYCLAEKKFDKAIEIYKYSLLFPENQARADVYFNMSFAYNQLGDEDSQVQYLRKSIKERENDPRAYEILAKIYYGEKLMPMAEDMLEKAVQNGSANRNFLQTVISQIGNVNTQQYYDELFNRSKEFFTEGKYLKTIDMLEFLIGRHYTSPELYYNLVVCYIKTGDLTTAASVLREAMSVYSSDSRLAELFNQLKN